MATATTVTIPIVLDASASATLFGESGVTLTKDFTLADVNAVNCTADALKDALLYRDQDSGVALFDVSGAAADAFGALVQSDLSDVSYTITGTDYHGVNGSIAGSVGQHYVQYLAAILFGHPLAQAPIKNDQDIRDKIEVTSGVGQQFADALKNDVSEGTSSGVVQSIYEQLLAADKIRFNGDQTGGDHVGDLVGDYVKMPFIAGDTIRFLIKMTGSLEVESSVSSNNDVASGSAALLTAFTNGVSDVTGSNVDEKVWQIGLTLQ